MALSVDDMVAMMHMLDADGDGTVSKTEFGIYYKRLKGIDDAAFDEVWRKIDTDGDGNLSVNELCAYYGIDSGECNRALQREKKREMSDELRYRERGILAAKLLEDALQRDAAPATQRAQQRTALATSRRHGPHSGCGVQGFARPECAEPPGYQTPLFGNI